MTDPVTFVLAVVGLLALPGPTNTLMATGGGVMGLRGGLRLIPAELIAYAIAIWLWAIVLGSLSERVPVLSSALRLLPGVVLTALAIKLWLTPTPGGLQVATVERKHVFLTTLVNPKALVFATHVFPPVTSGEYLLCLGAFMVLCVAIAAGWVALGSLAYAGPTAIARAQLIRRGAALVLLAFAVATTASVVSRLA